MCVPIIRQATMLRMSATPAFVFKKKSGSMSIQVEVLVASAVSRSANNEQYKSRINSMEVFENDFLPENRFQRPHGTL